MYFSATQLLTVALAGLAAAAPSRSVKRNRETVIGYRTVNKAEANELNDYETFVDMGNFRDEKAQTGRGKYLSPNPGEWNVGSGNRYDQAHDIGYIRDIVTYAGTSYCIVWADAEKYNSVSKVWIPEDHWWPNSEQQMKDYIGSLNIDGSLSLRYSEIDGKPGVLQMMVPLELFEQYDNGIGIRVQCFDSIDELKGVESGTVDYNRSDIQNRNGPAHPTPPDPAPPAPQAPPAPPGPPGPPHV